MMYNQNILNTATTESAPINNKPYESANIDILMSNNFNYDHVHKNVDVLKSNNQKDPFNFVSDLLKSKKA